MATITQGKNPAQRKKKKPFVVREIPAETFLDPRLRNGAHQLLGFLWSKADAKTGELRIGAHWLEQNELVRMARKIGMSESTFRRIVRNQLIPFGYVHEVVRKYREQLDPTGRKRIVLGPQHYIVFKSAQKPQKQSKSVKPKSRKPLRERVSTSGQNASVEGNAPPLDDSTSGQNVDNSQKGSTSGHSTSLVERPDNTPSKAPPVAAVAGIGSASVSVDSVPMTRGSSKAPPGEGEQTAKTPLHGVDIPKNDFLDVLCGRLDTIRQEQVRKLVALYHDMFNCDPQFLTWHRHYVKEDSRALALDWKDRNDLWDYIVHSYARKIEQEREQEQERERVAADTNPALCFCGDVHQTPDEWEGCYCWQCGCAIEHGHVCGIEEVEDRQTENVAAALVPTKLN